MNFKWPWVSRKTFLTANQSSFNNGFATGQAEERKYREGLVQRCELQRLTDCIGKPVIVISNEVSNVTVGIGVGVQLITKANCPVLVVEDVCSGEEFLAMGKVLNYSAQKFHALNRLTPQERIVLFYKPTEESFFDYDISKNDLLVEPSVWADQVSEALKNVAD